HRVSGLDARMCTAMAFMEPSAELGMVGHDADAARRMSRAVETLAAPLRTRGLTVSAVITEGDPKHVLLDAAVQRGADCIFVGARGLSGAERFLLGSVSAAVAARAHRSVEGVRTARAWYGRRRWPLLPPPP